MQMKNLIGKERRSYFNYCTKN